VWYPIRDLWICWVPDAGGVSIVEEKRGGTGIIGTAGCLMTEAILFLLGVIGETS